MNFDAFKQKMKIVLLIVWAGNLAVVAAAEKDRTKDMNTLDANNPEAVEAGTGAGSGSGGKELTLKPLEMFLPEVVPSSAVASAEALLRRVVAEGPVEKFIFEFIPRENNQDVFEIESKGSRIVLRGSDSVSMASALNWYLRYTVHRETDFRIERINLPDVLPAVKDKVRHVNSCRYRWFFNFCTSGYDTTWYDWPRTERLIDWLAMNGINLALAPAGQEAVWVDLLTEYGFTNEEARAFLGGPSFFPWTLMMNIDHFGGPMPQGWIDRGVELQKKTVSRMRELGIMPVYPGFNGHVPGEFTRKFPGTKLHQIHWYGPTPNTWMLDPKSPKFAEMGRFFVRRLTERYGASHFYAIDNFIEMLPPSNDPAYLQGVSRNVYKGLVRADPDAVWVLQGWMFMNPARTRFWQKPQREAFLKAVPPGGLLVLDMSRGQKASELDWFEGHAWLWCTVHDFGNKTGLYGNPFSLMNSFDRTLKRTGTGRLSGWGMVPEGLSSTPVVYTALMEMPWREQVPNEDEWYANYSDSRYGTSLSAAHEAWSLLGKSVFNAGNQTCAVTQSPDVTWAQIGTPKFGYRRSPDRAALLEKACGKLLSCASVLSDNPSYQYDLVSAVRDFLTDRGLGMVDRIKAAFVSGNRTVFNERFSDFKELMQDMNRLVGTQEDFLFGRWIADARACADNPEDADLYEWNARNILTLWGNKKRNIRDYARRHWAGLISGFYLPRWELFCGYLNDRMDDGSKFNRGAAKKYLVGFEDEWCRKKDSYAVEAIGDPVAVSSELLKKYRSQ